LSAATVALLQLINVWPDIVERAQPISRVHVSDRGHVGATAFSQAENDNQPLGFVVENRWFGYHLCQAVLKAQNISVLAPTKVESIRPVSAGAALSYRSGCNAELKTLKASLVIVGDGAESPLRQQLGVGTDIHDYQQAAVITNLEFEQPHQGQAFERFTEDGPLAVLPLPDENTRASRRAALVWIRPLPQLEETLQWSDTDFIQHIQHTFGYRLGSCLRVGERHSYPLKMVFAREQVRSSIVLIGNAAHSLHPVAGQGFNLAIRDCAQLTAVLVQANQKGKDLGDISVLKRYLAAQENDQALTAGIGHGFVWIFSQHNKAVQLGRNLGLLAMELWPAARKEFFSQMMGRTVPKVKLRAAGSI